MTKLEQLYNSIQNLKELGVLLPDKLIEETNRVEEEIIKNDIIPALAETISPVIEQIQREIVLVVEYIPNEPLSVKLTRKRSFAIPAEQDLSQTNPTKAQIVEREKGFTIPFHSKSKKTILSVTLSNGRIIKHKFAMQTMCDVIEYIGLEKVSKLKILCCGVPLIDSKKDDYYNQSEVKKGTFIFTHNSTQTKKQILEDISSALGLGLKVEIV